MLVKFREIIANLPAAFFLIWIGLFFADAANLDDFFSESDVLHTELPVSIFQYTHPILHASLECANCSKQVVFKNGTKTEKTIHYIVDEDSPSIDQGHQYYLTGILLQIKQEVTKLNFHSSNNLLYLQNCKLLI